VKKNEDFIKSKRKKENKKPLSGASCGAHDDVIKQLQDFK